jgi:hypothetical protein
MVTSTSQPDDLADRRAAEVVLGRSLSDTWPAGALVAGTRVRVVRDRTWDGPWKREFLGVIDAMGAPEPAQHASADLGEFVYWVTFDNPQYDSDGDGPYRKAQVWGRYLQAV